MKKQLYSSPTEHKKMKPKDLCIYQMNKSILILDTRTLKYINVYDSEIGERIL